MWREGMPDWAPLSSIQADPQHASHLYEASSAPESQLPALCPPTKPDAPRPFAHPSSKPEHFHEHTAPSKASDNRSTLDWEQVPEARLLPAFIRTLQNTLFDSRQTGWRIGQSGDWKLPLIFLALGEMSGTLLMFATISLLPANNSQLAAMTKRMVGLQSGGIGLAALMASSLLMLPLGILVKSAVLHWCLKIFGGSEAPFLTTFRALCYALGSAATLWLIPLISVAAATVAGETATVDFAMALAMASVLVWSVGVTLGCLASSHGMSTFKAALAIFLPPIVAFALFLFTAAR
ncbi:MAG: YIP1 family protein [Verrucomicrobia bacterium]|nr:YIP1 family protein [Verrucomicrobiota bacterium]